MARMTLDELVSQLRAAYGTALNSVVLYGSAAAGEHIAKKSDYNVLVIVDALDAAKLTAASAVSRAWAEAGNPAPLTLTTSEWRGSADIFPMEYADILERNRVLFGSAPFDGIRVDLKDLRLQLEQEAMGKLIKLRQGVLASRKEGFDATPFANVVRHMRGESEIDAGGATAVLDDYLRGMEKLVGYLDQY